MKTPFALLALLVLAAPGTSSSYETPNLEEFSCVGEGCMGGDVKCGDVHMIYDASTGIVYSVQCYESMN